MSEQNVQVAPYPDALADLVEKLDYRPGWHFDLENIENRDTANEEASGLTLKVLTKGYDTYHPDRGDTYRVWHHFPVPAATYNRRSWQRWLLDCILKVETHEACEFFTVEGEKPYAPHHGPGWDPYMVIEHGSDEDARTSFRGERNE